MEREREMKEEMTKSSETIEQGKGVANLIGCLSHKLFGWLSPDCGYSDDPADIIIHNPCRRLIRELLQAVVLKKSQCMCEHY